MADPELVFVRLKVPLATRQAWQQQAADQGMTLSDLIRQRMGDQPVAEPKRRAARRADPQLIAAVHRVGNNVNQIARWCNAHGPAAGRDQVLSVLLVIERELRALLKPWR